MRGDSARYTDSPAQANDAILSGLMDRFPPVRVHMASLEAEWLHRQRRRVVVMVRVFQVQGRRTREGT